MRRFDCARCAGGGGGPPADATESDAPLRPRSNRRRRVGRWLNRSLTDSVAHRIGRVGAVSRSHPTPSRPPTGSACGTGSPHTADPAGGVPLTEAVTALLVGQYRSLSRSIGSPERLTPIQPIRQAACRTPKRPRAVSRSHCRRPAGKNAAARERGGRGRCREDSDLEIEIAISFSAGPVATGRLAARPKEAGGGGGCRGGCEVAISGPSSRSRGRDCLLFSAFSMRAVAIGRLPTRPAVSIYPCT